MGIRLDLVGYVIGAAVLRHVAVSRTPCDLPGATVCDGIEAE
ncbi:MAG TPA: hypothetical protein VGG60_12100 [Candidatus Binataceae bacterium]|jgi:hypothetical protein